MSPALIVCAMGVCMTAVVGVMVGACMAVDFIVRCIDGRRHGP